MSKIMFFDIETSPNVVYSWRVGNKINLTTDNIVHERKIICISWKYEHEDYVYSLTWDKNQDDKQMLKEFGKELENCDVAIGHNGDKFDIKWVKTRNIIHKLPPLNNIVTIDTLKLARRYFNFNSNRLDYLGDILGVGRKHETGGYSLWTAVLDGDKKALNKMVEYCNQDVILLEDVFHEITPYVDRMPAHLGIIKGKDRVSCKACGSTDTQKYGIRKKTTGSYQRYKCNSCCHTYLDSRKL